MFKRHSTRSFEQEEVFNEDYWLKYVDNYQDMSDSVHSSRGILSYNTKRYTSMSTAVGLVAKYFEQCQLPVPSVNQIIALLKSPFTQGDVLKTFHLIRFYQLGSQGFFMTNSSIDKFNGVIRYAGAENWGNVMCYLDALLFAMFLNLESFEPILFISNQYSHSEPELVNQLAALLRVYVSLMRSGNLITTDLTIALCKNLAKLGFTDAVSLAQQDSASLFEFLTETLCMPLLTFKVDIEHGGKFSKDDDKKISKERILFVSLPEDDLAEVEDGNSAKSNVDDENSGSELQKTSSGPYGEDEILLEECLEHYFNNSINVRRELERRATLDSARPALSDLIPEYGEVTVSESVDTKNDDDKINLRSNSKTAPKVGIRARSSTLSIWSVSDEKTTTSKEVSLPAWMFLKLLPFYTDDNDIDGTARNSKEFVNRRPILPICLKRYSFDSSTSKANRSGKRVIIPPVIELPQFVADDEGPVENFKLILESAVCHRGSSITSGHFISVSRKDCHNVDITEKEAADATWYLFDDTNVKARITEKTFKEIFDKEWPYMLFYRLVSNDDENTSVSVLPPEGSKSKYWQHEEIISPELSAAGSPKLPPHDGNRSLSNSSASSYLSMSLPPSDSKFVDIRNKYFWYVTDKDHNYYKELPVEGAKDCSTPSSITFSPQFRRNSQWSHNTNVSSIADLMDHSKQDTVTQEKENEKEKGKIKDKGKGKGKEKQNEKGKGKENDKPNQSVPLSPELQVPIEKKISHMTLSDVAGEVSNQDEPPKSSRRMFHHNHHSKKLKKRRDEYRKEKCTIM